MKLMMVASWTRIRNAGNAVCTALERDELDAAEVEVTERMQQGLDAGCIYTVTLLVPCRKLDGKARFAWSFDAFGRQRSMAGVRPVKEEAGA